MMQHVLLLLLGAHLASAGTHSFKAFYTATTGITNYPEFTIAALVDDMLIFNYDSISKQVVPRTEWMKSSVSPEYWKQQTNIAVGTEPSFKNNIQVVMGRFNQTGGVHTVQVMYGCEFDDQTRETNAFQHNGYDGEDFLSLDLKEMRYISPVQQGIRTVWKLNNDRVFLENNKQYFSTECIEWLQKYIQYGKSSMEKTVSPQVSLLQKSSSSSVTCHATGFYPKEVKISWMRNGQEYHEDVEVGELFPNEDGTFQKTSELKVTPEEWKKNKFSCVVEHQGKTMTADEIRTNTGDSVPIGIIVGVVVAVLLLIVIAVVVYKVYQKKKGFKPVSASDDGSKSSTHSFNSDHSDHSVDSDHSDHSVDSDHSDHSDHSVDSDHSDHSDHSVDSVNSDHSDHSDDQLIKK